MSTEELIQIRMSRLQELRQYQAHYGPHTPYPVIIEINQLEAELGHLLRMYGSQSSQVVPPPQPKLKPKPKPAPPTLGQMSEATIDSIAMVTFISFIFLLGAILFAAYMYRQNNLETVSFNYVEPANGFVPTLRPTFTPTANSEEAVASDSLLPTPSKATDIPTLVPTVTPRHLVTPTAPPPPTFTPKPPPRPAQPAAQPRPVNTSTSAVPAPTPAPSYPFAMSEQGNREFQKTSYHGITIYIAVVSEGNIPLGGYKIVGNQVPSGAHAESGISSWNWDVVNCMNCSYIKEGNLKFEPGTFSDGVWNIYLADPGGQQLSPIVPLPYSSKPDQWVWDFLVFRRTG